MGDDKKISEQQAARNQVTELVIAGLAQEIAEKAERIASLEADVVAYRELSQQGIHALHSLTAQLDRLRQQHHRLLDECRALRVHTLRRAEAA